MNKEKYVRIEFPDWTWMTLWTFMVMSNDRTTRRSKLTRLTKIAGWQMK